MNKKIEYEYEYQLSLFKLRNKCSNEKYLGKHDHTVEGHCHTPLPA